MKFTLNESQSAAVRELSEAVNNVLEANILVLPDFAAARSEMKLKVEQLHLAFPNFVQPAADYNNDLTLDIPEWIRDTEDHSEAVFSALVSTFMIDQAETLTRFTKTLDMLHDELGDVASFSKDYDLEHASWK